MKRHPEIPNYTPDEWAEDLNAVGQILIQTGATDGRPIQEYTRLKYPDAEDAHRRAYVLAQAFAFSAKHREALEAAGIAVSGDTSNLASGGLVGALYNWFFMMPWQKVPPPEPNIEAIIESSRGHA
jgi:hypothetical protein